MKLLDNISLRAKAMSTVILLVLSIILVYFALFRPKIAEMSQTRARLETLVEEINVEIRREADVKIPTMEDKAKWAKTGLELRQRIPEKMELPRALESIAALARNTGIQDLTMESATGDDELDGSEAQYIQVGDMRLQITSDTDNDSETTSIRDPGLEQTTINFAFHCEYRDLAEFLEGLCSLPRLVVVRKFDIERELPLMSVTMSVRVFSLTQASSLPQSVDSI